MTTSTRKAKLPPIQRSNSAGNEELRIEKYRYSPIENPFREGRSYTIHGLKHVLPDPRQLTPHIDTKSGILDTWPAHATGVTSTKQVALSKQKQLVILDEEKMGKPQTTPKPKFLDNLEAFVKNELRVMGATAEQASDIRLQAYREAFEYLSQDFVTYKPLLTAIKNEYEMMLSCQREKIRQLEPLKQTLVSVCEACDQKISRLKSEEKPEMKEVKSDNARLTKAIADIKTEQHSLQLEVEQLQAKLAEKYEHFRDEADARKLLVIDITELRYRQEDLILQQQLTANGGESGEDPITTRIALKRARLDEQLAAQRLQDMIANFAHVVPRRNFEALVKFMAELNQKCEQKERDLDILKTEHDTLVEIHKQVIKQRDEFFQESEMLRRTATPRPDWERCADHIPGGIQRWLELSQGKSSEQLVDILLHELGTTSDSELAAPEYFEGQGTNDDVPAYLRHDGQVRNRHLRKRETSLMVKDIWKEKAIADKEAGSGRCPMAQFVPKYLSARFPLHQMVVEWAYNLHDSCQRFAHDERIGLFLGVLTEEIDEEIYFSQFQVIVNLLGYLNKTAEESSGIIGHMTKAAFRDALRSFFSSGKTESDIDLLVKAAEQELHSQDSEDIEFTNLFLEDDEGKFGHFVDEVKRQLEKEKIDFIADIMRDMHRTSKIYPEDLEKALSRVDPEADANQRDAIMVWAFRVKDMADIGTARGMSYNDLEQRLINGAIKRVGLKPSSAISHS